jgi:ABC-type branched-subunit amino acid transport system ATPase component
MATILEVHNLYKSFGGVEAVKDVSFELEKGQLLAMIGPNGAGKSTCFNLINGQLRPDNGRIIIMGTHLSDYINFCIDDRIGKCSNGPAVLSQADKFTFKKGKSALCR